MRASRLLSILLLLQTRGRMTAQALADELEVSVRTVYRDVDSLSAAGVPVYGDRGPDGGYRLLDGYRTRLTGLTPEEAESLFLVGIPGPAAELGLGTVLAAAQLKLMAALPPELRSRAGRIRERFHLDAPGWFQDAEQPPYLETVADAVWNQKRLRVRYQRWGKEVERTLEPLGVVLKGGAWYLVAAVDGQPRTYRVSRILELATTEECFERPEGFDLTGYWQTWAEQFLDRLYRYEAVVRLSPRGLELFPHLFSPAAMRAALASAEPPDADGWTRVTVPVESVKHAPVQLLRLGAEAEVLAPPEIRQAVAEAARALAELYRPRGADAG
ncbi:MAG TPA: YafY family protein [Thermomicrobiales bacterium]|jgi:predicted DNA-binding transcriptional regulator YafY